MKKLRKIILQESYKVNACHIGSALSAIDIIEKIYKLKRKKDIFLFGKASGIAALYAVLSEKGYFKPKKISFYLKKYPLPSKEVPGVDFSFGSLGHGLPVACGIALAGRTRDVYILISDGECDEGTTWESILFARQHKLKNLKIYVDKNGCQACGKTKDICDIDEALNYLKKLFPIKICKTVKAKGWKEMEGKVESHYCNITKEQYDRFKKTVF